MWPFSKSRELISCEEFVAGLQYSVTEALKKFHENFFIKEEHKPKDANEGRFLREALALHLWMVGTSLGNAYPKSVDTLMLLFIKDGLTSKEIINERYEEYSKIFGANMSSYQLEDFGILVANNIYGSEGYNVLLGMKCVIWVTNMLKGFADTGDQFHVNE